MSNRVRIACTKAMYERIVTSMETYFEDGRCALGRNYYSCPSIQRDNSITCKQCIRNNVIRIEHKQKEEST